MNTTTHIAAKQKEWYKKIKPFLLRTNLNVGSGLGYFSQEAEREGADMTSLEVCVHSDAINRSGILLYDGKVMPFGNAFFETATAMYVLHHTKNPEAVLGEMKRVASKRLILVEELYTSFFGKIVLMLYDFLINLRAHQKSTIHWNSYFNKNRFIKAVENGGWKITSYSASPKFGFDEILCVAEKI